MNMTKFLLKVGGEIFGYNDTNILLVHLMEHKPTEYDIFILQKNCLVIKYKEISAKELRELNKSER